MKNFVLTSLFLFLTTISFSQNYGTVLTPQEANTKLQGTAKQLFLECVKISGYSLEQMKPIEPENEPGRSKNTCSIQVIAISDTLFRDRRFPNDSVMVKSLTQEIKGDYKLEEPRFMVFAIQIDGGTKITLQKYY